MKFPCSELYLVTEHKSLPLGKVILSMGGRSFFQVHGFLSHLSHTVEQAMGWASVQRVLPCHKYWTVFKNAKGLGWWHWNAKRQPSIAATKSVSFNSFPQRRDSRRGDSPWTEFLTKGPWKPMGSRSASRHSWSWPELRHGTVAELWETSPWLRSLSLCSICCAGGKNTNFNIWWRVLWTEHQLGQPGLIM